MKLVVIAAVLLCHSAVKANDDDIAQIIEQCRPLAMDIKDETVIPEGTTNWFVDKVAPLNHYVDGYDSIPDENICSTVTFYEKLGCESITVQRTIKGKTSHVITRAESKKYKDVVEYHEEFELLDGKDYIYKGKVTKMSVHEHGGETEKSIPEIVQKAQGQVYALVDRDTADNDWAVYGTCRDRLFWALISKEAHADEQRRVKAYNRIDKAIRRHKLNQKICMKEVDKELLYGLH